MIKFLGYVFLALFSFSLFADTAPAGFLWYNLPLVPEKAPKKNKAAKNSGLSFKQLNFTQRDAVLHFYTMEALHKARQTHSIEDMKVFLSLQDYWLKESSKFSQTFQKTMLAYPQYDYSVTHPSSNIGSKLSDKLQEEARKKVINNLSIDHGLLFFYRGANAYDQKQIPIIKDFCQRFNLHLIPVSVDGNISQELSHSRKDNGQADALGVHYFPALLLVNPQSRKTFPVAYGLTVQDALEERLYQVATEFKGENV